MRRWRLGPLEIVWRGWRRSTPRQSAASESPSFLDSARRLDTPLLVRGLFERHRDIEAGINPDRARAIATAIRQVLQEREHEEGVENAMTRSTQDHQGGHPC